MKQQSDGAQSSFHDVESTTRPIRHIRSVLLVALVATGAALPARASLADTMKRSPRLGLQFIQDGQVVPLRSRQESDADLSISLRPRHFRIRVPRIENWVAQTPGLPGCPPSAGLHLSVGADEEIYSKVKIGEESGYTGFFGCVKSITRGPERPVTTLVVSIPEQYPYNYFVDDRYETVSATHRTLCTRAWVASYRVRRRPI